jgi:hypothetical protein
MSTVNARPTNGVSYGVKYTVTSGTVASGVTFDFRKQATNTFRYPLVANFMVTTASGAYLATSGISMTYPYDGQVKLSGTFILGSIIHLIAQRAGVYTEV